MNFHDQRIQWCKKTTCWYRQSSIRGKFVAMHGSGDDELHREMGTNGYVLEENAMARRHCALKIHGGESNKVCLVQEQPKISSKAISEDGCGVTTMETIPLETLSSTSRLKVIP